MARCMSSTPSTHLSMLPIRVNGPWASRPRTMVMRRMTPASPMTPGARSTTRTVPMCATPPTGTSRSTATVRRRAEHCSRRIPPAQASSWGSARYWTQRVRSAASGDRVPTGLPVPAPGDGHVQAIARAQWQEWFLCNPGQREPWFWALGSSDRVVVGSSSEDADRGASMQTERAGVSPCGSGVSVSTDTGYGFSHEVQCTAVVVRLRADLVVH